MNSTNSNYESYPIYYQKGFLVNEAPEPVPLYPNLEQLKVAEQIQTKAVEIVSVKIDQQSKKVERKFSLGSLLKSALWTTVSAISFIAAGIFASNTFLAGALTAAFALTGNFSWAALSAFHFVLPNALLIYGFGKLCLFTASKCHEAMKMTGIL